ncbi:MAG TPA: nucleotide disphospho-sugar-binding domain-containing protein [Caulobacter sp.]|nr:nucleotide disphospho-sugar-binding domain-containing protein [Caulobacter sp.]
MALVAHGTRGDVLPFVAVGLALQLAGHRVVLFTNQEHEPLAREAGLEFVEVGPPHPPHDDRPAHHVLREYLLPLFEQSARAVCELGLSRDLRGVVSHDLALGGLAAAERLKVPLTELVLAPLGLAGRLAADGGGSRLRPRAWGPDLLDRVRGAGASGRSCAPVRAPLAPADLTLALFPRALAPDSPVACIGFPFQDLQRGLDQDLERFLTNHPQPLVVTAGTGATHAQVFFDAAAQASRELDAPCVFLGLRSRPRDDIRVPGRIYREYVDLSQLLPRARLLFHHGGVGTLARALEAGTPQVIAPRAFDQPSNARHAANLGVCRIIKAQDLNGAALLKAIRALEAQPSLAACLTAGRAMAENRTAATRAAKAIARLSRRGDEPLATP